MPGMTETATAAPVRPAEIAAYLAARMCHDFISPASAISSGLDLLDDPSAQDMREEAMGLITSSARKLADLLSFCRVAFGASASLESDKIFESASKSFSSSDRACDAFVVSDSMSPRR